MTRLLTALSAIVLALSLSGPATADDTTTVLTAVRWGGAADKGDSVVTSAAKKRIVAAYGTRLVPTVSCSGTGCDPARPARIEILRQGSWQPWATGTLAELADSTKVLTSKRTTTFVIRSVLPASESLPAVASPRWSIRFLPGTQITVSGPTIIKPTPANDYTWQFRPQPGSVTIRVSPAAAGRVVELRDSMVEGYPLVGTAVTDAAGRATVSADFADVRMLGVTVLPTRARAGWSVFASPALATEAAQPRRTSSG